LALTRNRVANIAMMLIVDQLFALVERRKIRTCTFSMMSGSARKAVRDADVQYRMISIRDNVNPEIVIAEHSSQLTIRDVSTSLDMTKGRQRVAQQSHSFDK